MTKDPNEMWIEESCNQCDFFKKVICHNINIGICTQLFSDHNGHVLDCTHPACKKVDKGYPDESN